MYSIELPPESSKVKKPSSEQVRMINAALKNAELAESNFKFVLDSLQKNKSADFNAEKQSIKAAIQELQKHRETLERHLDSSF